MHHHPSMAAPIAARLRLPGGGRMRAFLLALVVADIFPCCSTTTGGHGQPVFPPSSQSWGGWKPSVPPGLGFAAEGGSHRRIIGGVDAQGRYPWAVQIGKVGGQALTVCIFPTRSQPSLPCTSSHRVVVSRNRQHGLDLGLPCPLHFAPDQRGECIDRARVAVHERLVDLLMRPSLYCFLLAVLWAAHRWTLGVDGCPLRDDSRQHRIQVTIYRVLCSFTRSLTHSPVHSANGSTKP
jgi:hypothetical protein